MRCAVRRRRLRFRVSARPSVGRNVKVPAADHRFRQTCGGRYPQHPLVHRRLTVARHGSARLLCGSSFSARSVGSGDVVHRHENATLSEGRQKPPAGLPNPARWTSSRPRLDEPHRGFDHSLPANGVWQSSWVANSAGWYKVLIMGSVHKFQRPPKNEQQFKGYRPAPPNGPRVGKSARRQLRNWQMSLIAWLALVLLAVGIWGIGKIQ